MTSTLVFTPAHLDAVMDIVRDNPISAIVAPTGTGKSTTVPQFFAGKENRIFVVQPNIVATVGLFNRMKTLINPELVGMAVEGEIQYVNTRIATARGERPSDKPDTRVVYCTSGHMRRVMLSLIGKRTLKDASLTFCDVLMLDEIHMGTLDYDIIMALWYHAYLQGAEVPRLVLSSATFEPSSIPFQLPASAIYNVPLRSFPVTVEYHTKDYTPDDRHLYPETADVVRKRHIDIPVPVGGDGWLVFCAGSKEVDGVAGLLGDVPHMEVIRAYADMGIEANRIIFSPFTPYVRRIIVATNIAESSITVPNLSGIFDTLTEKVGETSSSGGYRLALYHVSKSSAIQRQGRVGRTMPGFCYRMLTESAYNDLAPARVKEIDRVPLHSMVIELLDAGLQPETIFPSVRGHIQKSLQMLQSLGMITSTTATSGGGGMVVTPIGKFAPRLPLSVQASSILYHWLQTLHPAFPGIAVACLIDCYGPNYFHYPRKTATMSFPDYVEASREHYEKFFSPWDGGSDMEVLLKMWNTLTSTFKSLTPAPKALVGFCNSHSLNHRKIKELLSIARQVCNGVLAITNVDTIIMGIFSPLNVIAALEPIIRLVYAPMIFNATRSATYYTNGSGQTYKLETRQSLTSKPVASPQVAALITAEIQARSDVRPIKIISLAFPLGAPLPMVVEIGKEPELDEETFVPDSPVVASSAIPPHLGLPMGLPSRLGLPPPVGLPSMGLPPPVVSTTVLHRPTSPLPVEVMVMPPPSSPRIATPPVNIPLKRRGVLMRQPPPAPLS